MVKIARGAFYLGVLGIPWTSVRVGAFSLSDVLFVVAAILAAMLPPVQTLRPQPSLWIASALCILSMLSTAGTAVDETAAWGVAARILFVWTVWRWVARRLLGEPTAIARSLDAYLMGSAVTAGWAVLQALGVLASGGPTVGRATGLSVHPNGLGGILALAVVLGFLRIMRGEQRALSSLAVILSLLGLVASGSVSGMMAGLAGIALGLALTRGLGKGLVMILVVAPIALVALDWIQTAAPFLVLPSDRLLQVQGLDSGPSTIASRVDTIRYAFEYLQDHPMVGVGLDDASGATLGEDVLVHNMLVRAWYQGGLPLLLAWVISLTSMARGHLWARSRRVDSHETMGLPVAMLTVLIFSMTGPVLYERWFWLPFVLGSAVGSHVSRRHDSSLSPGRYGRVVPLGDRARPRQPRGRWVEQR